MEHCLDIISALKHNETNFNVQSQLTDACNAIRGLCCKAAVGSRPTATKVFRVLTTVVYGDADAVLSGRNLTTFRTKRLPNFQHSGIFAKTSVSYLPDCTAIRYNQFNIILKSAPVSIKRKVVFTGWQRLSLYSFIHSLTHFFFILSFIHSFIHCLVCLATSP